MSASWKKIRSVALVEYQQFVLTRTFLFLVLLSPFLIGLIILVTVIAGTSRDLSDRRLLVVDHTGVVFEPLLEAARRHNTHEIFQQGDGGPGIQVEARFLPEKADGGAYDDEREQQLELSRSVRQGPAVGFLIIEADALDNPGPDRIRYYSENRTYQALPNWLDEQLNRILQNERLTRAGLDPREVRKWTTRSSLGRYGLTGEGERGEIIDAEPDNPMITYLVPLGAMLILFFCANMSSPILLNTVMEEKMQKIMEVLLSALTPFELLMGKLIGSVFVAVTLGAVYLAPSLGYLVWRGYAGIIPLELLFWFPAFLLLTLFSVGSVWAAIGASCSELKDTQNFSGVAIFILLAPFIFAMVLLESPHTPFASVVSLLPAFYPFLMTIRLLAPPGPEWWELWLGLLLNLGFTCLVVWAGGRIFRRGILSQGNTPSLKRMVAWIWEET